MAWLETHGLCKRYGGVRALDRADFDLRRGEVHVLIGANGSGKSTLCKCLAGAVAPDDGEMRLDGEPLRLASPAEAERAGIGVFYQELSLIPQLTVAQNVFLDREPRTRLGFVDEAAMRRRTEALMRPFEGVAGERFRADRPVTDLSPDQRQIVEILKVLARRPPVILFDEATAALDRRQVAVFFSVIRELRGAGHGIVFISHRMDELFTIGDRITVLRDGRTVTTCDVADTDREAVVTAMVGESTQPAAAGSRVERPAPTGASVFSVREITAAGLAPVSFELAAGEILGLGGLHGQGQSLLLRTLFGAHRRTAGHVAGTDGALAGRHPGQAVRAGLAYISGDRGRDGIFPARNVFENLASAVLTREGRRLVRHGRLRGELDRAVKALRTKFAGYSAPVTSLSGGNQQKIVIGRWLAARPRVLLLDDPTKGIDLNAKADLYDILRRLAAQGVGIVFYSSDDAELLDIADRVLVFNGGRVVDELAGDSLNRVALYRAAYGGEAA